MNKLLLSLLLLLATFSIGYSQVTRIRFNGIASKGGKIVRTSPSVQYKLMETYSACTITIKIAGSATLATIYSDEIGTAKSNPFTSNIDASFYFYVDVGRYDITFSGTGILSPFTWADIFLDNTGGGGGGAVSSVYGRTGAIVAQANDIKYTDLDFTSSNFNSISIRSAS